MEITFATRGLVSVTTMELWLSSIVILATLLPMITNTSLASMENGFLHIKCTVSNQVKTKQKIQPAGIPVLSQNY